MLYQVYAKNKLGGFFPPFSLIEKPGIFNKGGETKLRRIQEVRKWEKLNSLLFKSQTSGL